MREATGGSLLLYLVIFFVGVIVLFFASMLSYSKAYRVKNRIINILEEKNMCASNLFDEQKDELNSEIETELTRIGYNYSSKSKECNFNTDKKNCSLQFSGDNYNYCICKVDLRDSDGNSKGCYYEVITFTQFEFPIIKDVLTSEVHGETKIIGKKYGN